MYKRQENKLSNGSAAGKYNETDFQSDLSKFLFSEGKPYAQQFKFNGSLACGQPAPKVLLSSIQYKHIVYKTSNDKISTMHDIENLVDKQNFSGLVFASAERYREYITTETFTTEVVRNVLIAVCVVFVSTLFLIGDILTACMVLVCVIFTIVDLSGFSQFWGLKIDMMFGLFLIISIGKILSLVPPRPAGHPTSCSRFIC